MEKYEHMNEMLKRLAREGKMPYMVYDEHGLHPADKKTKEQEVESEILNMLGLQIKRR